ncbi:hypothetical protein GOBAR_DD23770 [Gossypium barbadense]|nr:hypothetical protein GOBAR_DD23770 [Gossypium barbadense]
MGKRLMLNESSTLIPSDLVDMKIGVLEESVIPVNEVVTTMASTIVMAVDEQIGEGRWFCYGRAHVAAYMEGYSGGIWLLWNKLYVVDVVLNHSQFLHVEIMSSGPKRHMSHSCGSFQKFMFDFALKDIGFIGPRFTWKHGVKLERLDRMKDSDPFEDNIERFSLEAKDIVGESVFQMVVKAFEGRSVDLGITYTVLVFTFEGGETEIIEPV